MFQKKLRLPNAKSRNSRGTMPSNPNTVEMISIREIVSSIDENNFNLTPDYQRGRVWSTKLTKCLTETILSESPIGMLQLARDNDSEQWNYLDGANRTYSIIDFIENKFKVSGFTFNTLPEEAKEKFLNFKICFTKFSNMSLEEQRKKFIDIQNGFGLRCAEKTWADLGNPVVKIVREVRELNINRLNSICSERRKNDINILVNIFAMALASLKNNPIQHVNVGNSSQMQKWVQDTYKEHGELLEDEESSNLIKQHLTIVIDRLGRLLKTSGVKFKKNQYIAMDLARVIIYCDVNGKVLSDRKINNKLQQISEYQNNGEVEDKHVDDYGYILSKPSQVQYQKGIVSERFNLCKKIFI